MQATLNKTTHKYFKAVYAADFTREETAETVVPDVLPDISDILSASGIVILKGKEMQDGRVSVSAVLQCSVQYAPEDEDGIRALSLSIPVEISAESPEMCMDDRPVVMLELASLDARMLNPRKVLARADISVRLECYGERELSVYDAVSDSTGARIQLRQETVAASLITGVREKTFVISDEYPIPLSKPAFGEIIRQSVMLTTDEVKAVGNKLVFKGEASVSLMYTPPGSNEPSTLEFMSSYSQIMELDSVCEDPEAVISLMSTGVYFDAVANAQGGKTLVVELHAVAQCVSMESRELCGISDAYCNRYTLELTGEELPLRQTVRRMSLRETLRDSLQLPEPAAEIIAASADTGIASMDEGGISVPLRVSVIYRAENGRLRSASGRFAVRADVDAGENVEKRLLCCRVAEVYAMPAGDALELRIPVDMELLLARETQVYMLTSIGYDETGVIDTTQLPSLVLMRPEGRSLWQLAKEHCSTVEAIISANGIENEDELDPGAIIMIPRLRAD